ncbi:MAG: DUF484 family protein [Rhodospirillales bacterium]|nr:DUF484 family protein [Rhodospirillales bacterium]MBO6788110.1 DUF484 family protein [Rhodospirillales bacterium]
MSGELTDALDTDEDDTVALSADDVAVFLMRNPNFFADHPDVLDYVELPDRFTAGGVVDFQRYQLQRRDSEIDELRTCAQDVIETSRSNMSIQTRTHASILALLHATTLEQLYRIVSDDLPILLDVDVAAVGFEPANHANVTILSEHLRTLPPGTVDAIVGADQDVQLYREFWDDGAVFGGAAGLVKSAAIARIKPGVTMPNGLIALGARDNTFAPGQGTELFAFLARVIEASVMRLSGEQP